MMMIADRGHVRPAFREALNDLGIKASIGGRKDRNTPVEDGTKWHKPRKMVERMFDRLKDWRCIATSFDRCTHAFTSTCASPGLSSSGHEP
jgi:transposase